jgi:hypothetical protein
LAPSSEIESSFERLIGEMRKIVEAAGHLSAPVIAIDGAKVRLESCLRRVESLISLKMNLTTFEAKMKAQEYDDASALVE